MEEVEFVVPEAKRQKLIENGDVGVSMNLDDLPEGILLHILSLLPIKDAIKTSVLSRRWEHLWTRMPRLVINRVTNDKTKVARFMNLVEKAFAHRDSSSIESLSVSSRLGEGDTFEYRVRTWIMGAVRHKVQKLSIDHSVTSTPFCVFTCKTLVELHLTVSILKLPSSICLPCLKVLSLSWMKFTNNLSIEKLFSIPNLKELAFRSCDWEDLPILNISAPKLSRLSINCCDYGYKFYEPNNFQVLIDGGSLKSFEFVGRLNYDICISAAPVLDTVTIYILDCYGGGRFGYHMHKLLMGLSSTKFLSISSIAIEALYQKNDLLDSLPQFFNLKKLKFQGERFNFDCRAPLAILTKFPYLETLIFHQGIKLTKRRKKYKWILEPLPLCFLSELKNITIGEFDYVEKEMIILEILLGGTKVLKELVIKCSDFFQKHHIRNDVVANRLKTLCKWQEDCSIIFVPFL